MVEDRKTIAPVILKQGQDIIGIKWTSPKTSQKSLEQGVLWEVHPHTRKEVEVSPPLYINSMVKKEGWYVASLDDEKNNAHIEVSPLVALESSQGTHMVQENNPKKKEEIYHVLSDLHDIIKKRKEVLPEGSYTTHLFNSGSDKIRKKLGEEAVELILSQNKEDIINEGADLLFHFFVMLVNEGVEPSSIMEELRNRHVT